MEEEKRAEAEEDAKLLAKLLKPGGQSQTGAYQYTELPERCYCHTPGCGYILESPGAHCRDLSCPRCGARLWRVPP